VLFTSCEMVYIIFNHIHDAVFEILMRCIFFNNFIDLAKIVHHIIDSSACV